jgi:hypothetical protein
VLSSVKKSSEIVYGHPGDGAGFFGFMPNRVMQNPVNEQESGLS